jgi:hypothetical protein
MTHWLIWSNEHRAWWKPDGYGYTTLTQRAGFYTKTDAERIVAQANIVPRNPPNEVMVLAPDPDDIHREVVNDRGS